MINQQLLQQFGIFRFKRNTSNATGRAHAGVRLSRESRRIAEGLPLPEGAGGTGVDAAGRRALQQRHSQAAGDGID